MRLRKPREADRNQRQDQAHRRGRKGRVGRARAEDENHLARAVGDIVCDHQAGVNARAVFGGRGGVHPAVRGDDGGGKKQPVEKAQGRPGEFVGGDDGQQPGHGGGHGGGHGEGADVGHAAQQRGGDAGADEESGVGGGDEQADVGFGKSEVRPLLDDERGRRAMPEGKQPHRRKQRGEDGKMRGKHSGVGRGGGKGWVGAGAGGSGWEFFGKGAGVILYRGFGSLQRKTIGKAFLFCHFYPQFPGGRAGRIFWADWFRRGARFAPARRGAARFARGVNPTWRR